MALNLWHIPAGKECTGPPVVDQCASVCRRRKDRGQGPQQSFFGHEGCVTLALTGVAQQGVRSDLLQFLCTPDLFSEERCKRDGRPAHQGALLHSKDAFSCPEKRSPRPLLLPLCFFSTNRPLAEGRGCGFVSEREYRGRRSLLGATIGLMVFLTGASDHLRLD
jgi:hypothetical protein